MKNKFIAALMVLGVTVQQIIPDMALPSAEAISAKAVDEILTGS